jgi:diaminopimelate decarboxylase
MKLINDKAIEDVFKFSLLNGYFDENDDIVFFVDYAVLNDRIDRLKNSFLPSTLHYIPVKTNPLSFIVKYLNNVGLGMEAASMGELMLLKEFGLEMNKIIFDSPVKSVRDIKILEKEFKGIRINSDSLEELSRYKEFSNLNMGLRINPLIESDFNELLKGSGNYSKFGESLMNKSKIIEAFKVFPNLDCLHVHIGSQNSGMEPSIKAIREIVDLAEEINSLLGFKKIKFIDIGGGFPVDYSGDNNFNIEDFARKLFYVCPEFLEEEYIIITEFGRYLHAQSTFAISTVEYVKKHDNKLNTVISYCGANLFLRECYDSKNHFHNIKVINNKTHTVKEQVNLKAYNVAGPLCFGGDVLSKNHFLPEICEGDYLTIMDVGANTFSLFSRHCSFLFPKFIKYNSEIGLESLQIVKERENYESLIKFWS